MASSQARRGAGPLPRPATATDLYLAAVLDELRGIRRLLEQEDGMDTVELREPAAAICEECGRTFKTQAGLGRHRQAKH